MNIIQAAKSQNNPTNHAEKPPPHPTLCSFKFHGAGARVVGCVLGAAFFGFAARDAGRVLWARCFSVSRRGARGARARVVGCVLWARCFAVSRRGAEAARPHARRGARDAGACCGARVVGRVLWGACCGARVVGRGVFRFRGAGHITSLINNVRPSGEPDAKGGQTHAVWHASALSLSKKLRRYCSSRRLCRRRAVMLCFFAPAGAKLSNIVFCGGVYVFCGGAAQAGLSCAPSRRAIHLLYSAENTSRGASVESSALGGRPGRRAQPSRKKRRNRFSDSLRSPPFSRQSHE
jgi:hypothetical protein